MNEQFVVRMSAVRCENFFANLCSELVSMHPILSRLLLTCAVPVKSQLLVIGETKKV
jgi:hypothetical protein